VHNVFVDVTFLKTPKSLREKNVEFNELWNMIGQPSFHGLNLRSILMVRCNRCVAKFVQLWKVRKSLSTLNLMVSKNIQVRRNLWLLVQKLKWVNITRVKKTNIKKMKRSMLYKV
jgi:hypothetical protein